MFAFHHTRIVDDAPPPFRVGIWNSGGVSRFWKAETLVDHGGVVALEFFPKYSG